MRYFSMFTGIGGFEIGIQRAFDCRPTRTIEEENQMGKDSTDIKSEYTWESPASVGYSEIDKYAIATYEHNFKGHTNYGDATTIDEQQLPDFDLLVGGFPCQSFSVAGKRGGFNDTRGTLFFDVARILAHKRPGHFVLENVKGLLSHDAGKTFQTILGVLSDMGYRVEWQVLNSKDFGVPQNRERVYIVGHLGNGSCGQVFPIFGNNKANIESEPPQIANTLTANYFKGPAANRPLVAENGDKHDIDQQQRRQETADDSRELPEVRIAEATKLGYAVATVGDTINTSMPTSMPTSKTRRGRVQKGLAGTLQTSENMATLTADARIRKLTPIECERLQGFPDGWTVGSDTQRYKQCGNAVTTNVVQAVMERLYDH